MAYSGTLKSPTVGLTQTEALELDWPAHTGRGHLRACGEARPWRAGRRYRRGTWRVPETCRAASACGEKTGSSWHARTTSPRARSSSGAPAAAEPTRAGPGAPAARAAGGAAGSGRCARASAGSSAGRRSASVTFCAAERAPAQPRAALAWRRAAEGQDSSYRGGGCGALTVCRCSGAGPLRRLFGSVRYRPRVPGKAHRAGHAERHGLQQAPQQQHGRAVGGRRQLQQVGAGRVPACVQHEVPVSVGLTSSYSGWLSLLAKHPSACRGTAGKGPCCLPV